MQEVAFLLTNVNSEPQVQCKFAHRMAGIVDTVMKLLPLFSFIRTGK